MEEDDNKHSTRWWFLLKAYISKRLGLINLAASILELGKRSMRNGHHLVFDVIEMFKSGSYSSPSQTRAAFFLSPTIDEVNK